MNCTEVSCSSWLKHEPPPEIYREILSYLPAKSLVRFRSVSKEWKLMLEDGYFASLHLRRCCINNTQQGLQIKKTISLYDGMYRWRSKQVREISMNGRYYTCLVRSAMDGLLLLRNRHMKSLILCNLSIHKFLCIQPPWLSDHIRHTANRNLVLFDAVLGLDPSNNDYKVISFNRMHSVKGLRSLHTFSVKDGSWKYVKCPFTNGLPLRSHQVLYFGGYLHWIQYFKKSLELPCTLNSLNLTTLTFSSTPLPRDEVLHSDYIVGAVDGSFLGVAMTGTIWVLEGIRSGQDVNIQSCARWRKQYVFEDQKTPPYFFMDGRELSGNDVYVYDYITREKKIASSVFCTRYQMVDAYVESLVLLGSTYSWWVK